MKFATTALIFAAVAAAMPHNSGVEDKKIAQVLKQTQDKCGNDLQVKCCNKSSKSGNSVSEVSYRSSHLLHRFANNCIRLRVSCPDSSPMLEQAVSIRLPNMSENEKANAEQPTSVSSANVAMSLSPSLSRFSVVVPRSTSFCRRSASRTLPAARTPTPKRYVTQLESNWNQLTNTLHSTTTLSVSPFLVSLSAQLSKLDLGDVHIECTYGV